MGRFNQFKMLILTAIVPLFTIAVNATTFTEDGTISSGVFGHVYVTNTAEVEMTGGTVESVYIEEMGTLRFSNGTILDEVYVGNSGTFILNGASFYPSQEIQLRGAGKFRMNSGTLDGFLYTREYTEINILDGQIINGTLDSIDYSATTIQGGTHNFDDIWLQDFSVLKIYGGHINWLNANFDNNSIVHMYGGYIHSEYNFDVDSNAQFNVYYSDIIYDQKRGIYIEGYRLLDGSEFMLDQFTYSEIQQINFQYVPEPATLLLFSLGGILCKKL